jgi:signal transduction histidine kinase
LTLNQIKENDEQIKKQLNMVINYCGGEGIIETNNNNNISLSNELNGIQNSLMDHNLALKCYAPRLKKLEEPAPDVHASNF